MLKQPPIVKVVNAKKPHLFLRQNTCGQLHQGQGPPSQKSDSRKKPNLNLNKEHIQKIFSDENKSNNLGVVHGVVEDPEQIQTPLFLSIQLGSIKYGKKDKLDNLLKNAFKEPDRSDGTDEVSPKNQVSEG